MLQTILFTHDDLDGAGCRVIFELAHQHLKKGKAYDIIECSNSNINDTVQKTLNCPGYINENTCICFADICPSVNTVEKIAAMHNRFDHIYIWDHHRTALPIMDSVPHAYIVPENASGRFESGTSLLYQYYREIGKDPKKSNDKRGDYFHLYGDQELLSEFVDTIRSYDTWEWKKTNHIMARKLMVLFNILGMDNFCKKYISRLIISGIGRPMDLILDSDMEFINMKLLREKLIIEHFRKDDIIEVNVRGYKTAFLMYTTGANINELADAFLRKNPEFDIFAYISFYGDMKFEYRTQREDLNLGEVIAKPIGGGGHPKAAGSPVPEYLKELLRDIFVDHMNGEITRIP